ncbi:SGNH/GDSL hydrolase family protein [Tritonibacter mobilis]|uniref:GDSL family lipase n=1 Tax=Tritonibacter mobilis F1926 TaxID=1265309 RepID=A0A1B1A4E0_9RHOB|nr:SGNH/GDSL hydrolase family protein [Tritonibacter mobilis]ANP41425.1 GDSL family lipase [Tritonibacter mobilis F1926]KJZ25660.1 GDSL family lipase [Tritonibacter mobilis]
MMRFLLLSLFFLTACGDRPVGREARILAMGDSMMAWNSLGGQSIPDVVSDVLGEPVVDRSVSGARMIYRLPISGAAGLSIPKQYRAGNWDWVILNGGGNDLWLGCGCGQCDRKMDKLISEDAETGVFPDLVTRIRQDGARVILLGYLRTPGRSSPIENCRDEGDELDARLMRLAGGDTSVTFLPAADLVPYGDLSFHAVDRIHPSPKASRIIGGRVAEVIQSLPANL